MASVNPYRAPAAAVADTAEKYQPVNIYSASGRIGFFQQFTDNKDVLRAAVARIGQVPYVVTDYGRNASGTMTEYAALAIERKDDERLFEFYV